MDFVGETTKNGENICIILECQSQLPSDEDIERFFQYVSSLLMLKKQKVELYILCTKKAPYNKKEYVLNDDCIYTMHVISLKDIKAKDIFKRLEGKKYNQITEEDIASLQLIAYTDYEETTAQILKQAYNIVEKLEIKNINEKEAILYILNVLSVNMLEDEEYTKFMEEIEMILNPRDRYLINKTKEESNKRLNEEKQKLNEERIKIVKKLNKDNIPLKKIEEYTGLTQKQIQDII